MYHPSSDISLKLSRKGCSHQMWLIRPIFSCVHENVTFWEISCKLCNQLNVPMTQEAAGTLGATKTQSINTIQPIASLSNI